MSDQTPSRNFLTRDDAPVAKIVLLLLYGVALACVLGIAINTYVNVQDARDVSGSVQAEYITGIFELLLVGVVVGVLSAAKQLFD